MSLSGVQNSYIIEMLGYRETEPKRKAFTILNSTELKHFAYVALRIKIWFSVRTEDLST